MVYTNTTGRPIIVKVICSLSNENFDHIKNVKMGSVTHQQFVKGKGFPCARLCVNDIILTDINYNGLHNLTTVVPPGHAYKIEGNITRWHELR